MEGYYKSHQAINKAFQEMNMYKFNSIRLMAVRKGQAFKFAQSKTGKVYEMIEVKMKYPFPCSYVCLDTGVIYTSKDGFKRVTV